MIITILFFANFVLQAFFGVVLLTIFFYELNDNDREVYTGFPYIPLILGVICLFLALSNLYFGIVRCVS